MAQKFHTYGPDNVGQLLTTTQSLYVTNDLVDQFFNQTPFLKKMREGARMADGGASILVQMLYDENSTTQAYDGYDILDTTPQEGMTTGQAKWKNYATSVAISGTEERQNSGKERLIGLLEGKNKQARLSLKRKLTADLFASSVGSKNVESLVTMIDATSTIQEVNSTSNSWWQATATTGGSFAGQGLSDMRTNWTTIQKLTPEGDIDVIVTTDTIYNYYEGSLTPQTRYTQGGNYDGAPTGLKFKTANVFFDAQCNSGVMYMFPSSNLFLVINNNADMMMTPFVKPSNQDARVSQLIIMLQLVTDARRKLTKISSITA
jgi:hypothetical protein